MAFLPKIQEICGSFEADGMIESIKILDNELSEIKKAAQLFSLKPLPGESVKYVWIDKIKLGYYISTP